MKMDKELFLKSSERHFNLIQSQNICVVVYKNASGFLWEINNDGGTHLGWSDHIGDCEISGTYTTYEKALKGALDLIEQCSLEDYLKTKGSNLSNYGDYLIKTYL